MDSLTCPPRDNVGVALLSNSNSLVVIGWTSGGVGARDQEAMIINFALSTVEIGSIMPNQ